MGTPVSTPGGSSCGEGSELRRRKLQLLMQDLSALNVRLASRVEASEAAAPGLEPSLTLTEASGQTAAVVVQGKLTTAAGLLAEPQAKDAASKPGGSESAKAALEPAAPPPGHAASEPGVASNAGQVANVNKEKETAAVPTCKAEDEKETASEEAKPPVAPSGSSVAAFACVSAKGVNRFWQLISSLPTPKTIQAGE